MIGQILRQKSHPRKIHKKRNFPEWLKYEVKQFCINSSLHGYTFTVLPKRLLIERVAWMIIIFTSSLIGLVMLLMAWWSFQENLTTTVIDSTYHSIWNYPFPAVTICNFNKISKSKAYKLAASLNKQYKISNDELVQDLKLFNQIFYNDNINVSIQHYTRLEDILETNSMSFAEAFKQIAPTCDDSLLRCKWKNEEKRCDSLFEGILTNEGYCCSFNYFALKNHTFGGIQPQKAPKTPRKVSGCGFRTALEVLLKNNPDDYLVTQISSYGHKIIIHNSYSFPSWGSQSIFTEMKALSVIGLDPTKTDSTNHIRSLPVEQRNCWFPKERELQYFAVYTYSNCVKECQMNFTRRVCGCTPFYFYDEKSYGAGRDGRFCNLRDISCLSENKEQLYSTKLTKKINDETFTCECLPECEYVRYLAESSSGVLNRDFASNQQALFGDIKIANHTVFRVYFNDLVAIHNRCDITFTWYTLLAYYGGILSLFSGFNFCAPIEMLYFFIIKLLVDFLSTNTTSATKSEDPPKLKSSKFANIDVRNMKANEKIKKQSYF